MSIEEFIQRKKIKKIDLPLKRQEIFENQMKTFEDNVKDGEVLIENQRRSGALIHFFNAMERLIDAYFALKGIKVSDRFTRIEAMKELFGSEFLGEFEELYELRKEGMYEGTHISPEIIDKIRSSIIPKVKELIARERKKI